MPKLNDKILRIGLVLLALFSQSVVAQLVSPGKLSKAHSKYEGINNCTLCHTVGEKITNNKCLSCHDRVALSIQQGHGYHYNHRDKNCAECHLEHRGVDFEITLLDRDNFDHEKTGFELQGRHKELKCEQCHLNPTSFMGLEQSCNSCHEDIHNGKLGSNCKSCHSPEAFKPSTFKHKETDLAEKGKHKELLCNDCHSSDDYFKLSTQCQSCHEDEHKNQLGQNCEKCHGYTSFADLKFDHNRDADFKLEGAHGNLKCDECHENGLYKPKDTDCLSCHEEEHKGDTDEKCESCHNTTTFTPSTFKHQNPNYALHGAHQQVNCEACHGIDTFRPVEKTCTTCHEDAHKGTMDQSCETCHSFDAFKPSTFKHEKPHHELVGKHKDLQCTACHDFETFMPQDLACQSCHEEEHKGQLDLNCQQCHNEQDYKPSTFKHKEDEFQMQGAHARQKCESCHKLGLFEHKTSTCSNCHEDFHGGELGDNCAQCHSVQNWQSIDFDHNTSQFILRGQHQTLQCEQCHQNSVFAGTPTECVSCHNDPHEKRFGNECQDCHSEENWLNTQPHRRSGYVLLGQHRLLECQDCHTTDLNQPISPECSSCHLDDYNKASTLNHREWRFPSECTVCHRPTDQSWDQAHFAHLFFPLETSTAGHHAGYECVDCHTEPQNRTIVECSTCHEKADMEHAHRRVNNYSYDTPSCLSCHPTGEITGHGGGGGGGHGRGGGG